MLRYAVVALALLVGGAAEGGRLAHSTASARDALGNAVGAILQADGPSAERLLGSISADDLSPQDQQFRQCAVSRLRGLAPRSLITSPTTRRLEPVASAALDLYRVYWEESASNPKARDEAEKKLLSRLGTLLGKPDLTDIGSTEELLSRQLAKVGIHALGGRTGRLRELMLWTRQTDRDERVQLPEQTVTTRIHYLDGFASLGWSSFLTCSRSGTGGWTTSEGIYVVVPSYESLSDENFRVNLVAHESQHFADKRRFPSITGWELEYRAKLVELALAVRTKDRILGNFASNQGEDPAEAHSYANKKVLSAIRERLHVSAERLLLAIPVPSLHEAAIWALRIDTRRRLARVQSRRT